MYFYHIHLQRDVNKVKFTTSFVTDLGPVLAGFSMYVSVYMLVYNRHL